MASGTLASKLNRIMKTKIKLRTAIVECGVNMPTQVTFNEYEKYVRKIQNVPETTDIEDLILMCDMFEEAYKGTYNVHTYTSEEIEEIQELINLIVEGE